MNKVEYNCLLGVDSCRGGGICDRSNDRELGPSAVYPLDERTVPGTLSASSGSVFVVEYSVVPSQGIEAGTGCVLCSVPERWEVPLVPCLAEDRLCPLLELNSVEADSETDTVRSPCHPRFVPLSPRRRTSIAAEECQSVSDWVFEEWPGAAGRRVAFPRDPEELSIVEGCLLVPGQIPAGMAFVRR
jgi:hypothetical protein